MASRFYNRRVDNNQRFRRGGQYGRRSTVRETYEYGYDDEPRTPSPQAVPPAVAPLTNDELYERLDDLALDWSHLMRADLHQLKTLVIKLRERNGAVLADIAEADTSIDQTQSDLQVN
jgi:hypothetical protein